MTTSISTTATACLKSFEELTTRAEQPDYRHEKEVSSVTWTDELGRLRVWCSNVGALQTGQSSLESRLGDTSPDGLGAMKQITKQATTLLKDLKKTLTKIHEEVSEASSSASGELQELHEDVANIIGCLYRLAMNIPRPDPAAYDDASEGSVEDDLK